MRLNTNLKDHLSLEQFGLGHSLAITSISYYYYDIVVTKLVGDLWEYSNMNKVHTYVCI